MLLYKSVHTHTMRGLCAFFLSILTQVSSETLSDVIGLVGHNVTLPCRYDTQTYGVLSFCWGREQVPRFQCSDTVLSSQDGAVEFRQSSRYQLLGRETDGDISLTILDAQWSDGGVYGCRVEIPGWFNDQKVDTNLVMEEAPTEQPVTTDWTLAIAGIDGKQSEISASKNVEVGDPVVEEFGTTAGNFMASLEVGNIARTGAIFFSTIIIILFFIFRRRFQPERRLQHLNNLAVENTYECVPVRA
ncbi:hepatitis A virus cellular receptor 1 homolog isoform X1 [Hippoglossus hippoglossus]|uniref:hepatitis A virus cellular receptor 1 homolog isoform X1 n=1 Tax=Hippoglossus hippoglossus TaxID=8267 RepID=UPI00148D2E6E|nr:hepatitis A virus cellular receptor 1 homolog isoform X1 [Hippoglossus hippoglossus]